MTLIMIEPSLAIQKAIRAALVNSTAFSALVPAENIRTGSTRPDNDPCVIIGGGDVSMHGHDYAAQRTAWVYLDLHLWSLSGGEKHAKMLAFAANNVLDKATMQIEGGACDHFKVTRVIYPRDPEPDVGHAVMSVEAFVRWAV